jgi:hypothetical protein
MNHETTTRRKPDARRIGVLILVAAIGFAAGYIPQALERRTLTEELGQTQVELRLSEIHRTLGMASHHAMRNDYPAATTAAVDFFAGCRQAAETLDLSARPRTATALSAYAAQRDSIVAKLAAGDATVKEELAELYLAMDGVLRRAE